MIVEVRYNSKVNITFNDMVKVSVRGDQNYLVKWFRDNEFFGEMFLNCGTWGGYPMTDVANWRIEFWQENLLVNTYNNFLVNQEILIIYDNDGNDFAEFVKKIKDYSYEIADKFGCTVYVFFKGSELCDFSEGLVKPLRLNDRIENFKIIHTKKL